MLGIGDRSSLSAIVRRKPEQSPPFSPVPVRQGWAHERPITLSRNTDVNSPFPGCRDPRNSVGIAVSYPFPFFSHLPTNKLPLSPKIWPSLRTENLLYSSVFLNCFHFDIFRGCGEEGNAPISFSFACFFPGLLLISLPRLLSLPPLRVL